MEYELLSMIYDLARKAYWKGEIHCGAEFEDSRCRECQHWLACCQIEDINKILHPLNRQ